MTAKAARPLVFLARAPEKTSELARALERAGLEALSAPVIRAAPPASWRGLDAALRGWKNFDAAAFSSANAVDAFFSRARRLRLKKPKAPALTLAVGPATARALARFGWRADLVPDNPGGRNLARAAGAIRGLRVLVPRARGGKDDLIRGLRAKGARVEAVEAYRTAADRGHAAQLRRLALGGRLCAAAFFSGSAVRAFRAQIGTATWSRLRRGCLFAALGPTATQALRAAGARGVLQAPRADPKALARLITRALKIP
ncbi:MAG: uroporphyrinogen-III synthase [Elusimicrobia bacterium]|nr:uroporphyrinogen-III synthase [Elusimicrobiota bacterium]